MVMVFIGCGQRRPPRLNTPYPTPSRIVTTPSHFNVLINSTTDTPKLLWTETNTGFQTSEIPASQSWVKLQIQRQSHKIRLAYLYGDSVGPLSPTYTLQAAKPDAEVRLSCAVFDEETRVKIHWSSSADELTTSMVTIQSGDRVIALLNSKDQELSINGVYQHLSAIYEDFGYQSNPWQIKCEQ